MADTVKRIVTLDLPDDPHNYLLSLGIEVQRLGAERITVDTYAKPSMPPETLLKVAACLAAIAQDAMPPAPDPALVAAVAEAMYVADCERWLYRREDWPAMSGQYLYRAQAALRFLARTEAG